MIEEEKNGLTSFSGIQASFSRTIPQTCVANFCPPLHCNCANYNKSACGAVASHLVSTCYMPLDRKTTQTHTHTLSPSLLFLSCIHTHTHTLSLVTLTRSAQVRIAPMPGPIVSTHDAVKCVVSILLAVMVASAHAAPANQFVTALSNGLGLTLKTHANIRLDSNIYLST